MDEHSLPRRGSGAPGRATVKGSGSPQESAAQSVLLITSDESLRDDIALIAAVVGVRLETSTSWPGAGSAEPDRWAAVMCSPECLPPSVRQSQGTLLLGHQDDALWEAAAQMPGLRPVPLPQAEHWLSEQLSAQAFQRSQSRVVAAVSTAGGAGSTTFAYLCAAELAVRGQRPLLIDAAAGPSSGLADLVQRGRNRQQLGGGDLNWEQLNRIEGEISAAQLSSALPAVDGIGVLTGPLGGAQLVQLLPAAVAAGRRSFDVVIIDSGQRLEMTAVLGEQLDQLLMVTRASGRAVEAARQLLRSTAPVEAAAVVNRRAAAGWDPADIAELLGIPVVAELAEQKWLARADDLTESYHLLRSRRGARMIAATLKALGVGDA